MCVGGGAGWGKGGMSIVTGVEPIFPHFSIATRRVYESEASSTCMS